jgi:hypothetical protein
MECLFFKKNIMINKNFVQNFFKFNKQILNLKILKFDENDFEKQKYILFKNFLSLYDCFKIYHFYDEIKKMKKEIEKKKKISQYETDILTMYSIVLHSYNFNNFLKK